MGTGLDHLQGLRPIGELWGHVYERQITTDR